MSPQDLFNQLPSLNELVDHPRVKRAIDQWNRSEALARVRTAVHDLGAEVARRAEDLGAKSPADLLERLVERLDRRSVRAPARVINATGELWGNAWIETPLAEVAIDRMCHAGWNYTSGVTGSPLLERLIGAEASLVFASASAALAAAIEGLATESGDLICAKADASDPVLGCSLQRVVRRVGLNLVEVGGPTGATLADYQHGLAASPAPRGVLRRPAEFHRVEGAQAAPSIDEIAALARERNAPLLVDVGGAPPIDLPLDLGAEPRSAKQALSMGADLVVQNASGLLGGPSAGLLAAGSGHADATGKTVTYAVAQASPMIAAGVEATLELFADPATLRFAHPVVQRIDTPLDNLRTRAERLAPQIAETDMVDAAEPLALAADQAVGPLGVVRLPSWGVAITPADPPSLAKALKAGEPAVHSRRVGERLVLDLRTVAPADDAALLSRFGGPVSDGES